MEKLALSGFTIVAMMMMLMMMMMMMMVTGRVRDPHAWGG
jgi:hypothetical protein